MKLLLEKDIQKLQKMIFDEFMKITKNLADENSINIGLSGGSSVDIFYDFLKKNYKMIPDSIANKINYGFIDERLVNIDHIESNYFNLNLKFFSELVNQNLIDDKKINKINLNWKNICKTYSQIMPYMNIGFFGVGKDGHIGSLFPKHKLLNEKNNGYIQINDSPKPPAKRITISPNYIKNIQYCFVFFIGDNKKEAFERFLDPEISTNLCPAKLLLDCTNLVIISNLV